MSQPRSTPTSRLIERVLKGDLPRLKEYRTRDAGLLLLMKRALLHALWHRRNASKVPCSLLLVGESGAGKTFLARWLHLALGYEAETLGTLSVIDVPETLLASAFFGHRKGSFTGATESRIGILEKQPGVALIDEIGECSSAAQATLLRVTGQGHFCRIGSTAKVEVAREVLIFSTHSPGHIRPDLFYRFSCRLKIPSLRERPEDLAMWIEDVEMSTAARHVALSHDWPGNVRQLLAALRYAQIEAWSGGRTVEARDVEAGIEATTSTRKKTPDPRHQIALTIARAEGFVDVASLCTATDRGRTWGRGVLASLDVAGFLDREGVGKATRYVLSSHG